MPAYLTPGIYVEEVSTGARPITPTGTSTAAMIGVAPDPKAHLNQPLAVNNWPQFVREFAGQEKTANVLARAVFGFFHNGGSRCYVLNVGTGGSIAGDASKRTGITALETVDEAKIITAPGYCDIASYEALISHCEKMGDRFAILDAPENVDNTDLLKKVGTVTVSGKGKSADPDQDPAKEKKSPPSGLRARESNYAAYYFPWIVGRDPFHPTDLVNIPPSGHRAGVYARTDAARGVHKAPANEPIRGALGLTYKVARDEQGGLNRAGVNCIRFFPDAGIRVWGARTLGGDSSEWKYINVRRLFNMIEESIGAGTRWTVFEVNDVITWKAIERDIRAFLTLLWRDGALKGETPEQAFFVKCDAETNPPEVIDAGRLITEIGVAPVKPAEFIIFRIGQWVGGPETEEAGESAEGEGEA